MKMLITTGWNFMRILRVSMGLIALMFAFKDQDYILGIAGGLLVVMGVMNIGCCGVNGCSIKVNNSSKNKSAIEDVKYEEVV